MHTYIHTSWLAPKTTLASLLRFHRSLLSVTPLQLTLPLSISSNKGQRVTGNNAQGFQFSQYTSVWWIIYFLSAKKKKLDFSFFFFQARNGYKKFTLLFFYALWIKLWLCDKGLIWIRFILKQSLLIACLITPLCSTLTISSILQKLPGFFCCFCSAWVSGICCLVKAGC